MDKKLQKIQEQTRKILEAARVADEKLREQIDRSTKNLLESQEAVTRSKLLLSKNPPSADK